MRVLVCGGRDYNDKKKVFAVLDAVHADTPITAIVHGACRGADFLGRFWARGAGVSEEVFEADWDTYGRAAGPIRNEQMADSKPDLVIAFAGGRGTANMIKLAEERNLEVRLHD